MKKKPIARNVLTYADLTCPDSPLKLPTCFKIDELTNSPFHRTIYFYWSGRKHITPLLLMVDTLVLCLQFVIFYLSRADAERNIVRVDGKIPFTKYKFCFWLPASTIQQNSY
jgi:hypothetical protein